jgi:probable HAF family extracellular repeat protein
MPVRLGSLFRSAALRSATVTCAVAILASSPARVTADSPMYAVTDLGSLGCCNWWIWESTALALNNAGEVVGVTTSPTDPTVTLPFIYRNGQMTAITDWAGDARGINDAGLVTGGARPPGEIMPHLFGYQNGVFTDLGALPGYSNEPYAVGYAINSSGTMVGDSKDGAFIYENGDLRLLKRLSARYATGVNDYGDVVGLLETVRGDGRHTNKTFLFSGNNLIDIGTMDGDPDSQTTPGGINNRRQIVGTAWMPTQARAFLWENGVFHDVGALRGGYSYGVGMNNRGDVVGFSDSSVFVYRDGMMIDLNQALLRNGSIWPWIQDVHAINDNGQIVGNAYIEDADGVVHLRACLLTPVF